MTSWDFWQELAQTAVTDSKMKECNKSFGCI